MDQTVPPQGGYLALKCPNLVARDVDQSVDRSLMSPRLAAVQMRMSEGLAFEADIEKQWTDDLTQSWAEMLGDRMIVIEPHIREEEVQRRRERATMNAMQEPGNSIIIFNPRLPAILEDRSNGILPRVGEPDFLVRMGDRDGHPIWAPGDIKHHKTFESTTKEVPWLTSTLADPLFESAEEQVYGVGYPKVKPSMQLAHYRRLLEHYDYGQDVSDGSPYWGATIGKERALIWRDLDAPISSRRKKSPQNMYDETYPERIELVRHGMRRGAEPTLPPAWLPCWCTDCKMSEWRDMIHAELKGSDSIWLLPGVDKQAYTTLEGVGVITVTDLSKLSNDSRAFSNDSMRKTKIAARAAVSGEIQYLPGFSKIDIPRADVEIDFDLENCGEFIYMTGLNVTENFPGRSLRSKFTHYLALGANPEQEAEAFWAFWTDLTHYISAAREADRSVKCYFYSHHEKTMFKKAAARHEQPGYPTVQEVEEYFVSDVAVDMLARIRAACVLPTESYSLKDVAKLVGFKWSAEGANGDLSQVWYKEYLEGDRAKLALLREYNEDDVMAQVAVRDWVTGLTAN